jgi:hypothetical protein
MKRFICNLFAATLPVLLWFAAAAQSDSLIIDSLKKVLLTQKDTVKVITLNKLSETLRQISNDSGALQYASVKEPAVAYGKNKYTIAEYLEMEEAATEKHEYYQGEIFAMSGSKVPHNIITSNLSI